MVQINKIGPESYKVEIHGTSDVIANELSSGLFDFMQIMHAADIEHDTIISVIEQIAKTAITKFDLFSTTEYIDL